MVRAFLFDIGNVLLRFDFSLVLRAIAAESDIPDPVNVLANIEPIKFALEAGKIDRASFLRATFDVLRYRGSEEKFVAAWENIFTENTPMFDLVERLHSHYPLYLLSNTNDIHIEYILRTYPVFKYFTSGIYSHEVRAAKPDAEIFHIACRQLGVEPDTTFFIDDLLPNIETARNLGFQTHHYHHDRHGDLLEAVRATSVVVP